jgi:hypothetical protein
MQRGDDGRQRDGAFEIDHARSIASTREKVNVLDVLLMQSDRTLSFSPRSGRATRARIAAKWHDDISLALNLIG